MNLRQIYKKVENICDKGSIHSYIDFYDNLLSKYVGKNICLLEIGTQRCGSLVMWKEFLGNAIIHGIDIIQKPNLLDNHPDIHYHQLDLNKLTKKEVNETFINTQFDIIIEDADHSINQQLHCLKLFLPTLKAGGTYSVEDVSSDINIQTIQQSIKEKSIVHDFRKIHGLKDDVIIEIIK